MSQGAYVTAAVTTAGVLAGAYCVYHLYNKSKASQLPTTWTKVGTLNDMFMYPVKSCAGIQKTTAECTFLGLKDGWLRDRMDCETIGDLLKAIRDDVSTTHQKDDDIALPMCDPDKSDCGATSWCCSIETMATKMKWSSIQMAAKSGKALKGSALKWLESWEGRFWEKLRSNIVDIKLTKAFLYTSHTADSYGEYARDKLRLFRNIGIALTNEQLIELVCGGISDIDVRMASLKSGVKTTAALISLLSIYLLTVINMLNTTCNGSSDWPSGLKNIVIAKDKLGLCSGELVDSDSNITDK